MWRKRLKVASLIAVILIVGFIGSAFYIWRFEIMRDFRWEAASEIWKSRINAPVNTDYPFECAGGTLGRSDHVIRFANKPTRGASPLKLIIEDAVRRDRVVYNGEFADAITLSGIQYCEKPFENRMIRTYEQALDPEAQIFFGSFHFIIFDPETQMMHRAFAEAPGPIYSASEATVELYPFVREDVMGRYAVRIDTPIHPLPDWYQNPRLYSDPF